jgi:hypothetical protein
LNSSPDVFFIGAIRGIRDVRGFILFTTDDTDGHGLPASQTWVAVVSAANLEQIGCQTNFIPINFDSHAVHFIRDQK